MYGQAPPWTPTGAQRFNLSQGPATRTPSELTSVSSPSEGAENEASPWHPENPLFAFGLIAVGTFALMAVSTSASVKVGKVGASLNLGDPK